MRVEAYWGGELAAVLIYGREPVYRGVHGLRVKRLVEGRRAAHNLWTGEVARGPRSDTPAWWLSTIHSARLTRKGFTVYVDALPLANALPRKRAKGAWHSASAGAGHPGDW